MYELEDFEENSILEIVNSLENYNCRIQKISVGDLIRFELSLSIFLINQTSQPHLIQIFRDTTMHFFNKMKTSNYLKVVYMF